MSFINCLPYCLRPNHFRTTMTVLKPGWQDDESTNNVIQWLNRQKVKEQGAEQAHREETQQQIPVSEEMNDSDSTTSPIHYLPNPRWDPYPHKKLKKILLIPEFFNTRKASPESDMELEDIEWGSGSQYYASGDEAEEDEEGVKKGEKKKKKSIWRRIVHFFRK